MISIRNSLTELERCHRALDVALGCYRTSVADLALYTVALDDEIGARYRQDLLALADRLMVSPPDDLPECRDALHGLLCEYNGKAAEYVARLQQERVATERALQELAASLTQADDDYDGQIRATVDNLRTLSRLPEGKAVRDALRVAADSIERGVEQIRKQHQSTIAQFHKEIRTLRAKADPAAAETAFDSLTRLFDRTEMQERIVGAQPGEYCLAIIRVRGLKLAAVQHGPAVATQLATAFVVRLRNTLPCNVAIGRWAEEIFISQIPVAAGVSNASICKNIVDSLPGQYACLKDGKSVRPSIEISACVVDSGPRDTPSQVLDRVGMSLVKI